MSIHLLQKSLSLATEYLLSWRDCANIESLRIFSLSKRIKLRCLKTQESFSLDRTSKGLQTSNVASACQPCMTQRTKHSAATSDQNQVSVICPSRCILSFPLRFLAHNDQHPNSISTLLVQTASLWLSQCVFSQKTGDKRWWNLPTLVFLSCLDGLYLPRTICLIPHTLSLSRQTT